MQKAREQGQFLSAKDFTGALQFLCFVALLGWTGQEWLLTVQREFAGILKSAFNPGLGSGDLLAMLRHASAEVFMPLAKAGALLGAISLGAHMVLSSGGFSLHALAPKASRFNPVKKLADVARQSLAATVQAVLMLAILASLAYSLVQDRAAEMHALPLGTLRAGAATIASALQGVLWKCALVLLVFGAIDLVRQKRRLDGQLKMTKQEVRDESKENEGNPHMKMHIRRLRRELLRGRMMSEVPHATAVLVNPTHYSVAIRYEPETMASPVVVAKGKNYLAKLIREKALSHQVPIVENPPLARALYTSAEVGQQIPVEFYRAVAEVLAYIYRMMKHQR